jgi:hypothetical protein
MIYVFGKECKVSYVIDVENELTEKQKSRATIVSEVPEYEHQEGKIAFLCLDEENKKLYYKYELLTTEWVDDVLPEQIDDVVDDVVEQVVDDVVDDLEAVKETEDIL